MSLSEVLESLKDLSGKFENLQRDVDELNAKDKDRSRSPRSKSKDGSNEGPYRKSRGATREGAAWSWSEVDPEERTDYDADIHFSDEEGSELAKVSEETRELLISACTRSVSNEERKGTQIRYKLPKVTATRTPCLDQFMRSETHQTVRSLDNDLSGIQAFILDAMAPLTSLLDNADYLDPEDIRKASITAVSLIGNASSHLSHLRREKVVTSVNKALLPLVKEDDHFAGASPNLFGPDFAKRSKEFLDQVKALRSSLPVRTQSEYRKPFFRKGLLSRRVRPPGEKVEPPRLGRTDRTDQIKDKCSSTTHLQCGIKKLFITFKIH